MPFYEEIADIYDEMTRFDQRLEQEIATLAQWRQRYHVNTVLDVACGTGLHALALARLGIAVTGADLSEAMLSKAKVHAQKAGAHIAWIHAPMQELAAQLPGKRYDAIFCLGNSLPHLLEPADLETAFENFATLLAPQGILVLQLLNYERVLTQRERIVGIRRQDDILFVRFYDFHPPTLTFNILTIHTPDPNCPHHLHSTTLYPYQHAELVSMLPRHGFSSIEYYGTMQFQPFDPQTSPDLIVVAQC